MRGNFSESSEIQTFFPPKIRRSPKKKKKRSSPKLRLIFRPKSEIQSFFRPKTGGLQKNKKKRKVFTEIETDFPPDIGNSDAFSGRITTCTLQLRHPIFFGGGCFQFFTKNRPQKHQKHAILHTSQANGGARALPPPPLPKLPPMWLMFVFFIVFFLLTMCLA